MEMSSFPDYFSFIKRLMELVRTFPSIRRIELEIQTLTDNDQQSPSPNTFN